MVHRTVPTSRGDIPILHDEAQESVVLLLAHGAGGHMEHKTMAWLSQLGRLAGASIVRFNFLYRVSGKSMPDRMPVLMEEYCAVIGYVLDALKPDKLVIGGHSMGGRVASMLEAKESAADGLILFGYPLHPPGKLDKLRDAHLSQIRTPTLQLNGTRDEFCDFELMTEVLKKLDPEVYAMEWIEGADHSYTVARSSGRTRADAEHQIVSAISAHITKLASPSKRGG